jgi:hypothetical protein
VNDRSVNHTKHVIGMPSREPPWEGLVALDRHGAKNLPQQLALDTSASTVSTGASPAAGGKLAGFYCLVCGYVIPAEECRPVPAPVCAGSRTRTGRQHEPARMAKLRLGNGPQMIRAAPKS